MGATKASRGAVAVQLRMAALMALLSLERGSAWVEINCVHLHFSLAHGRRDHASCVGGGEVWNVAPG